MSDSPEHRQVSKPAAEFKHVLYMTTARKALRFLRPDFCECRKESNLAARLKRVLDAKFDKKEDEMAGLCRVASQPGDASQEIAKLLIQSVPSVVGYGTVGVKRNLLRIAKELADTGHSGVQV